jgi:hypothetical protein
MTSGPRTDLMFEVALPRGDRPASQTVSTAARVVARWAARRPTTAPGGCEECGETLEPGTTQCPQCRQAAPVPATGMLAVLVSTADGERLVIAERTPTGGWAATRSVPATPAAVVAVARHDLARGTT